MKLYQWNKKLELGLELIDSQHKQIISYANSFFTNYQSGSLEKSAQESIDFLQQYILFHFQAEESFQADSNYPSYREHLAKHKYLKAQVRIQAVRMEASNYDRSSIEAFYEFLTDWVENHIMQEDMAFAIYYKANEKQS